MSKDKTAEKVFIKNENLDEKMYRPSLHFSPKKKLDE
jgi:sucrose-6-phosphate hydrolase SacC (GH32 family)